VREQKSTSAYSADQAAAAAAAAAAATVTAHYLVIDGVHAYSKRLACLGTQYRLLHRNTHVRIFTHKSYYQKEGNHKRGHSRVKFTAR
jgi:hypothetical protein